MIAIPLAALANHLWQSTVFAGAAALLAFALRRNRAQVRYWLWLAASAKMMVPFAALIGLGSSVEWRTLPPVAPPLSAAMEQVAQPFGGSPVFDIAGATGTGSAAQYPWAAVVWFAGFSAVCAGWWLRWRKVRTALRDSRRLPAASPIEVRESSAGFEPGVFGVFRPVLVLPQGLADRLTPDQFAAILAHELCHVRRRDNLAAAFHMVVEAVFWFHPIVWWIGARMVEERERACDEEVIASGGEPEAYAAGILNVCRYYLESPLACASGVTGADLKKRIEAIMTNRLRLSMTLSKKVLLAIAAIAAVAGPIAIGVLDAPRLRAQTESGLKFEVASIKPADPNVRGMGLHRTPGGGLSANGATLKVLIELAYDVQDFQLSGGPAWFRTERFDIAAKPERPEGPADIHDATAQQQQVLWAHWRERMRALLAERFQLTIRRETGERPVYLLTVAKNGHKLQPATAPEGITRDRGRLSGNGGTVEMLAKVLGSMLGRPVLDRTGLAGEYKFKMEWAEETGGMKEKVPGEMPSAATPSDLPGPSIYSAIQEQMGLKLDSSKGPVEVLAIERAERPSAN